jgi:hypothetical protein
MKNQENMLINSYRKLRPEILTLVEIAVGCDTIWKTLRPKLLSRLGMNGFEKELLTFLKGESCERTKR